MRKMNQLLAGLLAAVTMITSVPAGTVFAAEESSISENTVEGETVEGETVEDETVADEIKMEIIDAYSDEIFYNRNTEPTERRYFTASAGERAGEYVKSQLKKAWSEGKTSADISVLNYKVPLNESTKIYNFC